jgi:hypothetical protein
MLKYLRPVTPYLICIFLFFYCWNVYWGSTRYKGFFLADSNGYYAYLPATFIYHDFNFSFTDEIQKKYFPTFGNFDFRQQQKSGATDKWFCGTAVAIAPFFLISHFISLLKGADADGYSFWYAWGLNMAAIFYLLTGLLALRKILRHYIHSENIIVLVMLLTVFGTNLFYYATSEPLMSHVYSFAFINLFVVSCIRMIQSAGKKNIPAMGLLLGMIMLIRPVNGLIIFIIPFLAGSREKFNVMLAGLMSERKKILLSLVLFFCAIFIQLVYYKLESGSWLIYSYGDEKMNLLKPHLADFLFSYKKGLFVYLPLIFLSLAGLIFFFRKNKWQFYALLIFICSLIYILSSWWNWWYGGSFATRPVIEFLFIFSILLATAIENFSSLPKKIYVTFCLLCLLLCQVQTYQYRYYFIHWDRMTKESYWKVFMRVDLIAKKENPNANLMQ